MTTNTAAILDLLCNYPKAQKQIREITGITGMYYSLAFGVTPAIFVLYEKDGDSFL